MDIAVITRELSPLTRNGGIGTAVRHLRDALLLHGHRLTVYHTGRPGPRLLPFGAAMRRQGLGFSRSWLPCGSSCAIPRRRPRRHAP